MTLGLGSSQCETRFEPCMQYIHEPYTFFKCLLRRLYSNIRRIEKNVAIYAHIEAVADGNLDRWLNAGILARDLGA